MVGKRKRTVYRKSRKRRGFLGVQKQQCEDTEISQNQNENVTGNDAQSSGESCPCPTQTVPLSASRRKLTQHEPQDKENDAEDDDSELYRSTDLLTYNDFHQLFLTYTNVKMVSFLFISLQIYYVSNNYLITFILFQIFVWLRNILYISC